MSYADIDRVTISMAMDELGVNDEMTDDEAKKKWKEAALPRGVEFLRDVCELRNMAVARLANLPAEAVRDMLKRDNPKLIISLDQLKATVVEAVQLGQE